MGKITIFIQNPNGINVNLEVNSSDKISYGKKLYSNLTNLSNFDWFFNGMILRDEETFESYEIEEDDSIIVRTWQFSETFSNKDIKIFINNINTNDTRALNISMDKTVKELKKEIEKLFNLSYSLDEYSLKIKINGMRGIKLINEQDENKTLFENNFKSECYVMFSEEKKPKPNRFSINNPIGIRRQYLNNKNKLIYITYVVTNDTRSLNISMDKTVKELKKEIEYLFNLYYSLDEYALKVKYAGMVSGKLINEQDENKTLFENGFKSECVVFFGNPKINHFCEICNKRKHS